MKLRRFSIQAGSAAVLGRSKGRWLRRLAFSLIEILVTVALLAFIILGLLGMFIQTQKAFRGSMKQTDVLGTGRATMDMVSRELTEITPAQMGFAWNFVTDIPPGPYLIPNLSAPPNSPPYSEIGGALALTQALPGSTYLRTNIIERVFFLRSQNQDWVGTGYEVVADYPGSKASSGVGTLYRFTQTARNSDVGKLWWNFATNSVTNLQYFSRIADGVVHFRAKPYATNGFPIVLPFGYSNSCWFRTNVAAGGAYSVRNTSGFTETYLPGKVNCYFSSNAVPAFVELELGVLEPNIFERYKSLSGAAADTYLAGHVANVHIFRQRVPIRNVDFAAYQ